MNKQKVHVFIYVVSIILFVLIVFKAYEKLTIDKQKQPVEAVSENVKLIGEGDIVLGEPDAQFTIYLFGNYRCKFCSKFFKEVLPTLLKEYPNDVKVNLKLVPFSDTQEEMDALLMAISVFKYGDYQPFHDLLLKDADVIFDENYKEYLIEIMGLNEAIATSFLDDKTNALIEENKKLFRDLKLTKTPTFIIGKKIISGYVDVNRLKELIDSKLKNKL